MDHNIDFTTAPDSLAHGLQLYFEQGVPMGSFGMAVLKNDLIGSFERADHINRNRMFEIVSWIYNNMPIGSYGSEEDVMSWTADGGLAGKDKKLQEYIDQAK